ncbi:hypothetical protein WJU23_19805 [Prosthecobacter sp. SYSU 5D2]|uniref:hypothetical protein n=1 Tax=Prosthecobacter sp. SYSU 5D2 TaxID=3134134 RepID=UPI0031FF0A22
MKVLVVLLIFSLPCWLAAHPADVTPLRVKVERQELEFRFTISLYTLAKMLQQDFQTGQRPGAAELEALRPALEGFLRKHVLLRINNQPVRLGESTKIEPLWPLGTGLQTNDTYLSVDITFVLAWPEVIGNVWLEFTGFPELGELATLQTTYEQGELRMQVPFSPFEPDYLYDTGFAVEGVFAGLPKDVPSQNRPTWESRAIPWVNLFLAFIILSPLLHIFRKPRKGGES